MMKEELTIEDVAMYLPWNVNMIFPKSGDVRELTGVFMEREELRFCFGVINRGQDLWKYKLALRPMSDLTDEFIEEVRGSMMISKVDVVYIEQSPIGRLKYYQLIYLWQNHFDVKDLIGRGLAVNLNDLKL